MTTDLHELHPGQDLARPAPLDDHGIAPLDPLAIGLRDVDRTVIERATPLDHDAVKVRVRERDARDAAERAHLLDAGGINVAGAVPEQIAARRAHEQCALTDGDGWRHADAVKVALELADLDAMTRRGEFVERRPLLTALPHVLPLVLADQAVRGRDIRR